MAHINRRFIDKHWGVFIARGVLATVIGCLTLFSGAVEVNNTIVMVSVFLLLMGIVDAVGALYNSSKKRGWANSIIDALIDIAAAVALLFYAKNNLVSSLIVISIYTILSGVIDLLHGFLSTVDPTDRFIRILSGICGTIIGLVILNAGDFEIMTFIRFFGTYMLIVGITSMIYGVHNRSQKAEDTMARKEARELNTNKLSGKSKKH